MAQEQIHRASRQRRQTGGINRRRVFTIGFGLSALLALGIGGEFAWQQAQKAPRLLQQIDGGIPVVVWSPDLQRFAMSDDSGSVTVWTLQGHKLFQVSSLGNRFDLPLSWSPDGQSLALGGQTLQFYQTQTHEMRASQETEEVTALSWSPDGSRLAVGNERGTLQIWDSQGLTKRCTMQAFLVEGSSFVSAHNLVWSPDSTQIASLSSQGDTLAATWDARTGEVLTTLPYAIPPDRAYLSQLNAIAWSPDGQHIAAGYGDGEGGRILLWTRQAQTHAWKLVASRAAHSWIVSDLAWSPDSSRLVSVGQDNAIRFWRASNGEPDETYTQNGPGMDYFQTVSWSADGKHLLTGDDAGQILLWNVE